MANVIDQIQTLVKALEAGSYNAAPSTLVQGAALQVEDLSPVMHVVTYDDSHIKLQKMLKSEACKSVLAQFDRQLSYGQFGGSAQLEGQIGQEETSDFVRIVVPMCFYSHTRRVTLVANLVDTVDGKKADERAASDAAKKLSADIEFDLFRGKGDFTNAGVFDGNPLLIPALPNILGLDAQVRQSDNQRNAQDIMFAEYGSNATVVISGGSTLTQDNIEDASVRSAMNFGSAEKLIVDPMIMSHYNKIAFGKERIILAGAPQEATSADLRKQWVSGGVVSIEASRFLSGKTQPSSARSTSPTAPTTATGASSAVTGVTTSFVAAQTYAYYVTAVNENGESTKTTVTMGGNNYMTVGTTGYANVITITPASGVARFFNVYRSAASGSLAQAKFIGRIINSGSATTTFYDIGNKIPGFVTGFLVEGDTMTMKELSPYSQMKLAVSDLSQPTAFFRFVTLAVTQPRKNVLIDNLA